MVSFNIGNPTASSSTLPIDHPPVPLSSSPEECPVNPSTRQKWLRSTSPTSNPLSPSSSTSSTFNAKSNSKSKLSADRTISSIPRGNTLETVNPKGPSSEGSTQNGGDNWVYPSEQQFFSAMQRKNHNPNAKDMKTIVPIHNAVNEKAWEQVLAWEAGMGSENCGGPRLISFSGRPKDRTPKAWVKTALGYKPPFDRHDWLIDRCGTTIRYVIDFYEGRKDPDHPERMGFYLDVRPAVDTRAAIETRVYGEWRRLLS